MGLEKLLYKDENEPSKLRSIVVPTALQRIIANYVARTFCKRFTKDLLLHNFAVGIENRMDFVIKASQLSVEKYITSKQHKDEVSLRCFVSLDLKNMFNEVSRNTIFGIITSKYPELLLLVFMLYKEPGYVFYKVADGNWYTQLMEKGVNQGFPL